MYSGDVGTTPSGRLKPPVDAVTHSPPSHHLNYLKVSFPEVGISRIKQIIVLLAATGWGLQSSVHKLSRKGRLIYSIFPWTGLKTK